MNTHSPTPWRVGDTGWDGDGSAGIEILDADGEMVAFVVHWTADWKIIHEPSDRDRANAEVIVAAVNALHAPQPQGSTDEGKP